MSKVLQLATTGPGSSGTAGRSLNAAGPLLESAGRKIQQLHLDRLAVVYVRQSTQKQVLENRESTELQYALARRAQAYGWPEDRVLIIDDDLGQSGRTAENRLGFQRLLAEVGLNHVGLVLGIEMSRLARSCKDWYQLLELCALFDALLADQDGLYDPSDYNDRLLLGLKGTMSEAELHILRNRMQEGLRNKARRGDLFLRLPVGYVFGPSGEVTLDPDEQTRALVRLLFDKFDAIGTGRGVSQYLRRQQIQFPFVSYAGPNKGQVVWRLPSAATVYSILHHPFYAGAYAYGRRQVDPRRKLPGQPHSGRISFSMPDWEVLLRDRLPAYITWEKYLANQELLSQNQSLPGTRGAPRQGATLLSGLIRCGVCDWRMQVVYHTISGVATYHCPSLDRDGDHTQCQNVAAHALDDLVSRLVLKAVEPASLSLSLRAAEDLERERERQHGQWHQQLERAQYHVQRAKRQYDAVDPDNRLVARELEKQWEQAMRDQRRVQEQVDRLQTEQPAQLSAAEREQILTLASDLPALWNASGVTPADRQMVIRCLVERIVVKVQGNTEFVDVEVHWTGGFVSCHETRRPVGRYDLLRDYDRLKARLIELRREGKTKQQIAEHLNREGFYPPRQDHPFTAPMVCTLLCRWGLSSARADSIASAHILRPHESWLQELSRELRIPHSVLAKWCCRGWVHARKVMITRCRWIVWADDAEKQRLRQLHATRRLGPTRRYPPELTNLGPRPDDNG